MQNHLVHYILGIADSNLILGQRLGELCGHGPNLETDIALTNISLDLLGQVRSYYQYAASLLGNDATEDTLAFLRIEREYRTAILCQQPNTDFAWVIARQFLFDAYHLLLVESLVKSSDETLSAIAQKAVKEVRYHRRVSTDGRHRWGDGTEESHRRIQDALNNLYIHSNALFAMDAKDVEVASSGIGVDLAALKQEYFSQIQADIQKATLSVPEVPYFQKGGKDGIHSEHMGYILTEMQYMQRTYPNMTW
ncbi:MAG: 1,2-phenylacetyl-CoA epoxidase subunit PaaC [Bacteroidia bacterium]